MNIVFTDIIVDVGIHQIRVGVVENQKLVELYIEEDNKEKTVGNIYRGIVKRILPGIQAAFIDIGKNKNAYLNLRENQFLGENDQQLKQGDHITVQVQKEAMGSKGYKVTSHFSFAGKYCVLIPGEKSIGISRKINDEKERLRLKELFNSLNLDNYGIIFRTNSLGKEEEELIKEIQYLKNQCEVIKQKERYVKAPALLYKELSFPFIAARDLMTKEIRHFIINDKEMYEEILAFLDLMDASLKEKLVYKEEKNLFAYFLLETQIERALSRHIWLKSGGMIIIDHTEALTVIDVNTAKYTGKKDMEKTILQTNIEAAQEIVKQLRLRNIGGIIIIDFIDMKEEAHKEMLIKILEEELKKDRVKTSIFGFTKLGLVELTRKKTGPSLTSLLLGKCPYCSGRGMVASVKFIADKIAKEIDYIFTETIYNHITIEANKDIIHWFCSGDYSYQQAFEERYEKKLEFIENNQLAIDQYKLIKKS